MILCDIGNTSVDLFIDGERTKLSAETFEPATLHDDVYYVSVNASFTERIRDYPNWYDLREFIDWEKYYPTMGIDRIMVCEAVEDGVIVDAGSAITVDVMRGGVYQGDSSLWDFARLRGRMRDSLAHWTCHLTLR